MRPHGIQFVWDRFERLRTLLWLEGFEELPVPEATLVDPSKGTIEVVGRLLDSPEDIRVVLVERWIEGTGGLDAQRGMSLCGYSYKAIWINGPDVKTHCDFEPVLHPKAPLHWHPPFIENAAGLKRRRSLASGLVQPPWALHRAQLLDLVVEGAGPVKSETDLVDLVDSLDLADYSP
jgi:hypothetical protein